MFNKKITVLILISVFVVGLQMVTPVNALDVAPPFDSGNFKVSGFKVGYDTYYGKNKNELYLNFYMGKPYEKQYLLKKSNNNIKSYEGYYNKNDKFVYKHLKTYKTTNSLKTFYSKTYKPYIIKQEKSNVAKHIKKYNMKPPKKN